MTSVPGSRVPPLHVRRLITVAFAGAAAILLYLVYRNGLDGPFLLDDHFNIPGAVIDEWRWARIAEVLSSNASGIFGRPLAVLSFALNHELGADPYSFKLINLMLHGANALLVWWLSIRWLRTVAPDESNTSYAALVAGLAALLWALHPLQLTAVLYVVQRMALLSATGILAALLCYASARERLLRGDTNILLPGAGVVVFTLAAILSKESGALAPCFIAVVELTVYRFRSSTPDSWSLRLLVAVTCVLPIAAGLFYFLTHTESLLSGYALREFSLGERLLTQPGVLWFYLRLVAVPDLSIMSLFHDDYPIATQTFAAFALAAIWAALIVAAVIFRNAMPLIAFAILWFVAAHLMESTVIPLELVFEHRNYLALLGILLPLSSFLMPSEAASPGARVRISACAVLILGFAFQTHVRADTWSSAELLALVSAAEKPQSARAQHHFALLLSAKGNHADALVRARRAEQLNPANSGYTASVLIAECTLNTVSETTLARLSAKLASRPLNSQTAANLKQLRRAAAQRSCDGLDPSVFLVLADSTADYAQTSERDSARRSVGLTFRALALSEFPDRRDEAIEVFREAWQIDPGNLAALLSAGRLLGMAGRIDDARALLGEAKRRHHQLRSNARVAQLERRLDGLRQDN